MVKKVVQICALAVQLILVIILSPTENVGTVEGVPVEHFTPNKNPAKIISTTVLQANKDDIFATDQSVSPTATTADEANSGDFDGLFVEDSIGLDLPVKSFVHIPDSGRMRNLLQKKLDVKYDKIAPILSRIKRDIEHLRGKITNP